MDGNPESLAIYILGCTCGGLIIMVAYLLFQYRRLNSRLFQYISSAVDDLGTTDSASIVDGTEIVETKKLSNEIKQFKLGKKLRDGNFGAVFFAQNALTGVFFVTQRLSVVTSQQTAKLRDETQIASELSAQHENFLKVLGTSHDPLQGHFYIHSEYVANGSMSDLAKKLGGKFAMSAVKNYSRQILSALGFLHANDLVHGNVSPQNIFITCEGICKLAFFGRQQRMISNKELSHNITYFSPELLVQSNVKNSIVDLTPATDIWAFGVTVIEIILGHVPWNITSEYILSDDFQLKLKMLLTVETGATSNTKNEVSHTLSRHLGAPGCNFVYQCLQHEATSRPLPGDLLQHEFLNPTRNESKSSFRLDIDEGDAD